MRPQRQDVGGSDQPPMVSVIMPVYNGGEWLGSALDSALAQSFRSFEIIVVNDGSTDASLQIANDRSSRSPNRVRIIDQDNTGLPRARNAALAQASGQYFALLDADDMWQPDHLERMMAAFDKDPDLGLVHANIERIDSAGQHLDVPKRCWSKQSDTFEALALRHEHVSCPTAVFSRTVLQMLGGFDPRFTNLGCEDRDLWLRIAARFRIRYLDHVSARYRVHLASMSANRERMAKARKLLIAKLARTDQGALLVPRMEAMLESDLGLELLEEGCHGRAVGQQWRALRLDPFESEIQRRMLRTLFQGGKALSNRSRQRNAPEEAT